MKRAVVFLVAMVLCWAASVSAAPTPQTKLDLSIGWDNVYRTGHWVPVYVTLSDPKTRQAVIEVEQPHAGSYVIQLRQPVVIGPVPQATILYLPLANHGWNAMPRISIRDVSGDLLAEWSYQTLQDAGVQVLPRQISSNARLVGVVGKSDNLSEYVAALGGKSIEIAALPVRLLPDSPVGYDLLDLLILNRADLSRMDEAQQNAIVAWVRAGGVMVVVPGDEGTPANSPLGEVLPAKVGQPTSVELPAGSDVRAKAGSMMSFALTPTANAIVAPLPFDRDDSSTLKAYSRRLGFGRIIVLPLDLVRVPFNGNTEREAAFKKLLEHTGVMTSLADPYTLNTNAQECSESVQDHLANVPGAGRFGFGYVGWGMLAMMLLVGPIDWFVLKLLRRQPWTWITLTGWIGLLTGGAIMIGQVFKSGDLHFRTVQLVDQADDQIVARNTVLGIYSPRTTQYELQSPDATSPGEPLRGWWQPAVAGSRRGGPLKVDVGFDRTTAGVSPRPLDVAVWNVRFLSGQTFEKASPWVAAELEIQTESGNPVLVGTLRNTSPYALTDVRIDTEYGYAFAAGVSPTTPAVVTRPANDVDDDDGSRPRSPRQERRTTAPVVIAKLAAGESVKIRSNLAERSPQVDGDTSSGRTNRRYYRDVPPPESADAWALTPDLSAVRSWREVYERKHNKMVTVYANANDAPPSAKLPNPDARVRHETLLRAILSLKGGK